MPETINAEWLNTNSQRAYPFRENSSLIPMDSNGNQILDSVLPNYLIVDFILTLTGDGLTTVYMAQVAIVGNLMTMVFRDGSNVQVGTVSVNLSGHITNQAYPVVGIGNYAGIVGRIVLGDLANLHVDLADGLYNFSATTALFEYSTVRPMTKGISSLRIEDEGAESDYIFGHVKLLAGRNVQLTFLPDYNAIRIDAIDGTNLNEECDCPDEIGRTNVVRTINGIPLQDVSIIGDGQGVSVQTSGNTITISDVLSQPCCGCPELEAITQQLNVMDASLGNMQSYANQLNERIQNFVTNYILTITG